MFAPVLMGLSLFASVARAEGEKMYRNDGYPTPNAAGLTEVFGPLFDGQPGLGKFNCMASVFTPDEEDYPIMPTELRVLIGGSTDEMLTQIRFYWYERDADVHAMNAGAPTLLDQEFYMFEDNLIEGVQFEIPLAENAFNFDGDHSVAGIQPIDSGSIVVSICFENEQTLPIVGFDQDGWEPEPEPDPDEVPLEGHETSRFRNLIYWNGLWVTLDDWLFNVFDYTEGGDWIMRLIVETEFSFDTGEAAREPIGIESVLPEEAVAGESVTVLVTGWGFDDGSIGKVGEHELIGVNADPAGEHLNGRTNKDMDPGLYDIEVINSAGDAYVLKNAFTVAEEIKGCSCAASGGAAAAWWLPLMAVGWRRRRD